MIAYIWSDHLVTFTPHSRTTAEPVWIVLSFRWF